MEKRNVATAAREKEDRDMDDAMAGAAFAINSIMGSVKKAAQAVSSVGDMTRNAMSEDEKSDEKTV